VTRLTLDALNAADRKTFVSALEDVFEDSPWIVERAWLQRPFATLDHLHRAMTAEIDRARRDEQLSLLRAHPDLGARQTMSAQSTNEQSGAGLTRLDDSDLAKLRRLNAAYREKFGFPFLYAVKGSSPHEIIAALEERSASTLDAEFSEAIRQVHKIGWLRLQKLVAT
jgi:2-oxo-4-hydroxy-4-carboxy-5-ureidoimidazoline decarboxylase